MTERVFISYKSEQRAIALRVRDVVQANKRPTWFDRDDIPEGAFFRDAIDEGLRNSAVVVGILTAAALNSREVKFEWNYAVSGKARLILLRYEALAAALNDSAMRDIRNKAAPDEVLTRTEAQQARAWAVGILRTI